uniref:YABBY N-terminal domain-containing protein n=1 Tax=Nelumbo nucifera TaxID=4432 RepID=A0A822XEG3_NELNU|nr:TPA_asm: hypothetical protein HUJ06_020040 [Nelumbo nucifera]
MSSSSAFSLDHLSPSEQLCYVHCNFCDTVLAVSVPCSSLFKTVTVRCGHCTNLLSVNMRGLLLPAANQLHLGNTFFSPSHNFLEEIPSPQPNLLIDQPNPNDSIVSVRGGSDELPRPPAVNRREILCIFSLSLSLSIYLGCLAFSTRSLLSVNSFGLSECSLSFSIPFFSGDKVIY